MVASILVTACGGGGRGAHEGDAGAPDAGASALTAPAMAEPVDMRPCPDGWHEVQSRDATWCEPWPSSGVASCTGATAHFPGGEGCARIGSECPTDGWPRDLPAGARVLFVRAGAATAGADGSQAHPYATIGAALTHASGETTVAIASGTYDEILTLRAPVTLWGACVEQTILTSTVPSETDAVVMLRRGEATIRNLQVRGERPGVLTDDAHLTMRDVLVSQTRGSGVTAVGESAVLEAQHVVVRDTRRPPRASSAGFTAGIGAQATLAHVVVERCWGDGLYAIDRGAFEATDVVVRDTVPNAAGLGPLVSLSMSSRATLRASVLEGAHASAIATRSMSGLTLDHVVVRGVEEGMQTGYALLAAAGTTTEVTDTYVADTTSIAIALRGTATLGRLLVEHTAQREQRFGVAVAIEEGANVTWQHGMIDGAGSAGVLIFDPDTRATITDLSVFGTAPALRDDPLGHAVVALNGAHLALTRARLEEDDSGIAVLSATAELSDLRVRNLRGRVSGSHAGIGLVVAGTAGEASSVSRAVFSHCRTNGVIVEGASLTARELVIEDTLERDCSMGGCEDGMFGSGLVALTDSHVDVERFRVARSALCGAQVLRGAELALRDGDVVENPIGINIQSADFDAAQVADRVRYLRNQRNVARDELPAPSVPSLDDIMLP